MTPDLNNLNFELPSLDAEYSDDLISGFSSLDAEVYSVPISPAEIDPGGYAPNDTGVLLSCSSLFNESALGLSAAHDTGLNKSNARHESLYRPFSCPHERCDWTFATRSALASYAKIHKHRNCPEGCGGISDMYRDLKEHLFHVHGKSLIGGARV